MNYMYIRKSSIVLGINSQAGSAFDYIRGEEFDRPIVQTSESRSEEGTDWEMNAGVNTHS